MCKIKVDIEPGPIPTEKVAYITNAKGEKEQVFVSSRSVEGSFLKTMFVKEEEGQVLVELPRETVSGAWRVWVPKEIIQG